MFKFACFVFIRFFIFLNNPSCCPLFVICSKLHHHSQLFISFTKYLVRSQKLCPSLYICNLSWGLLNGGYRDYGLIHSLFLNLQINIILQDYLKSAWKTIKFKLIFYHLRNCSSQSEKSGQPMREQKYSHWRKQLTDIQGERKRVD